MDYNITKPTPTPILEGKRVPCGLTLRRRMVLLVVVLLFTALPGVAQEAVPTVPNSVRQAKATTERVVSDTTERIVSDTLLADSALTAAVSEIEDGDAEAAGEGGGLHKQLKRKFIEGSASFMTLVALALVLGLAFCIERIIFLTLSEVNAKKLVADVDARLQADDVAGAKELCRNTRGPVASICYQGLLHIKEPLDQIDRQLTNYGQVQISQMEKGCSWIRLFIAVAPSLGFLGTVIGMVMAFDRIQTAGDISPTIVAEGMKVALITTIFGIIVAVVLQFFYNYIISKIDRLTLHMEESAIVLIDSITEYKTRKGGVKNG